MAKKSSSPRATAETMALRQREISVSEFFAKNRHLLGFDNPRKALLTTVKEAVDNSLDACEEAGILPDITVVIEDLQPERAASAKASKYRVTIVDNGPGIVRKQVEHIFGRLLYGSKFHRLKMSRGQQGIGISAAGMYGLLTTGKPMVIHTRSKAGQRAHHIELAMNTKTNRAEVTRDDETDDFPIARLREINAGTRELSGLGEFLPASIYPTGTSVSIELEGRYQRGRGSVDEFLELTAIANPHARIVFVPPSRAVQDDDDRGPVTLGTGDTAGGPSSASAPTDLAALAEIKTTETNGVVVYPRGTGELPPETHEIQPHPKGIELGMLIQMLKDAEQEQKNPKVLDFLQERFSKVSAAKAGELGKAAQIGVSARVGTLDHADAERLFNAMQDAKLPSPPTDCLAPIGVKQMLAGMLKGVRAEFYTASSRSAEVYRGRPFLIEAAIAFGGDLPADDSARVIRFANRVPLLFQQSACSSFKAVTETMWRNYGLSQPRGGGPVGPLVVMIHMASVWVPFTSESKEAIADYDEIRKEMKLALMECGRKLGTYLRKRQKMRREAERRDVFERYIGEIAKACEALTGTEARRVYDALLEQARKKTDIADAILDDEGKVVGSRREERGDDDLGDDVVIVAGPEPQPPVPAAPVIVAEPEPKPTPKKKVVKKVVRNARGAKAGSGQTLFAEA
jgi:DNA topoisomerase-6 subunit B